MYKVQVLLRYNHPYRTDYKSENKIDACNIADRIWSCNETFDNKEPKDVMVLDDNYNQIYCNGRRYF